MPNRLAASTSPYLLQHQDNPVDWQPWGDEAFAEARERDVPVLLSIGYAACHWCHVMAHESFEDPQVAVFLNANFVPVKVDREERPAFAGVSRRIYATGSSPNNTTVRIDSDVDIVVEHHECPTSRAVQVGRVLVEAVVTPEDEASPQARCELRRKPVER